MSGTGRVGPEQVGTATRARACRPATRRLIAWRIFCRLSRGSAPIPPGAAGAVAANTPRGFGAEDVRTPERFATPSNQLQEITARVRTIRPREPGVYAFTLEDGAEWLFAESVGREYRVPRAGAEIGIERGALGSYLMRFDDQSPVSVRRIR